MKEELICDDTKYTEVHIPYLKDTLYNMDTLTEEENTEARKILASQITTKISTVNRLLLMIRIKEQIVGRKKRRFYVDNEWFLQTERVALRMTQKEVFAQLIDGELKVSGGINDIFKPRYGYDADSMKSKSLIQEYSAERLSSEKGHWTISRNFKKLSFCYHSDKNWGLEKDYEGSVVH